MAICDPVADFLTRIRNALRAEHRYVDVDWSKMRESIVEILKKEGFVENYLVKKESSSRGKIRLFLKYSHGRVPVIHGIKRVSKPGLRRYVSCGEIPSFFGGMGVSIVSTSKGVMSGKDATDKQCGGELVCLVW